MFGGSFLEPALRGVIFTRVRLRSKKPLRFKTSTNAVSMRSIGQNPGLAFKGHLSESVRYAEAPERPMTVCLSTRKEEREAKAEILHVAKEFLARFEQPGLQEQASADAPPAPAPNKLYAPAMTQGEMSPAQRGYSDTETSASEATEDSITLVAKSS